MSCYNVKLHNLQPVEYPWIYYTANVCVKLAIHQEDSVCMQSTTLSLFVTPVFHLKARKNSISKRVARSAS